MGGGNLGGGGAGGQRGHCCEAVRDHLHSHSVTLFLKSKIYCYKQVLSLDYIASLALILGFPR